MSKPARSWSRIARTNFGSTLGGTWGRQRDTYSCVHDRDRDQIGGDIAFYLLRDFHNVALTPKARQYLDEAVQEDIAGHEKKKEKQHRHKEAARKMPDPGEQLRQKSWALR
jgi:hypothetical protein